MEKQATCFTFFVFSIFYLRIHYIIKCNRTSNINIILPSTQHFLHTPLQLLQKKKKQIIIIYLIPSSIMFIRQHGTSRYNIIIFIYHQQNIFRFTYIISCLYKCTQNFILDIKHYIRGLKQRDEHFFPIFTRERISILFYFFQQYFPLILHLHIIQSQQQKKKAKELKSFSLTNFFQLQLLLDFFWVFVVLYHIPHHVHDKTYNLLCS